MWGPRPAELSPELRNALETQIYCSTASQCKLIWERGIYYVANYARWPIVAETANLIETEHPYNGRTGLAFRITREPMADGSYRIATTAWCGLSDHQCKPHADEGIARAKYYMMTGQRQGGGR